MSDNEWNLCDEKICAKILCENLLFPWFFGSRQISPNKFSGKLENVEISFSQSKIELKIWDELILIIFIVDMETY